MRVVRGPVGLRIGNRDPADVECLLSGGPVRIDVVALASSRAWELFDTQVVHQAQAFGGAGNTSRLPIDLPNLGTNAAWLPVERELVSTNGSQSRGGSFVTVTITGRRPRGPSALTLAKSIAATTLAVAPRGPNPGPPPS